MLSPTDASPVTPVSRTPFDIRQFPWIKPLAADYVFAYERLADFFAGDPGDPAAWAAAIDRTQQHPREHARIAELIAAQQQRRGAPPEAMATAAQLADPRTVAVVTGQQAGLFGGPLFTLLKALTALRLAERVRAEHDVPAVAVFWVDAEDHDWDEVKSCRVLDANLHVRPIALGDPPGANQGPVARVCLDASTTTALDALAAALPQTDWTPDVMSALTRAYEPGTGMAHAFAQWLESVLGRYGLIVYDASDPAAKPLASRIFAREIERPGQTARLALDAGAALEARGYHAQAKPQDGSVALFRLDGGREPITCRGDAFMVGDRPTTQDALLSHVAQTPREFSPNVLLRPLVQDTLFPTVCYVAGPNELAYLGQLKGVYEAFGIPMPLIHQRASATLVDGNTMRFLARHQLPLIALQAQDDAALNALLQAQLPPEVETSLDAARHAIDVHMQMLAEHVRRLDATLENATRSTLTRMHDDLAKLQGKVIQAAKRKDETLRRQFEHARAQVFPDGHPQERAIGFVSFLDLYGPTLVDRLQEAISLEMGSHWVLAL